MNPWRSHITGTAGTPNPGDKVVRKDGASVEFYINEKRAAFAILTLPNGKVIPSAWHHNDTLWYFSRHIDGIVPLM